MPTFTVADTMIHSATRLSTFAKGKPHGTGTGFFYDVPVGDGKFRANLVITNKHVVEGAEAMDIVFHVCKPNSNPVEPSGEVVKWRFDVRPYQMVNHPDPDIDLCAINIATPITEMEQSTGKKPFFTRILRTNIPTGAEWETFDSVEEVMMIGCPRGIFDEANNIPIVRRGITATSLAKRYNGKNEFMVDMACFPGSSGSPVFIHDNDGYYDRKANKFLPGASRYHLVGVLYAGPLIAHDGAVIQPQGSGPRVAVASPMHLGNVIRATELVALEQEFMRVRAEAVARIEAREKEKKKK